MKQICRNWRGYFLNEDLERTVDFLVACGYSVEFRAPKEQYLNMNFKVFRVWNISEASFHTPYVLIDGSTSDNLSGVDYISADEIIMAHMEKL